MIKVPVVKIGRFTFDSSNLNDTAAEAGSQTEKEKEYSPVSYNNIEKDSSSVSGPYNVNQDFKSTIQPQSSPVKSSGSTKKPKSTLPRDMKKGVR